MHSWWPPRTWRATGRNNYRSQGLRENAEGLTRGGGRWRKWDEVGRCSAETEGANGFRRSEARVSVDNFTNMRVFPGLYKGVARRGKSARHTQSWLIWKVSVRDFRNTERSDGAAYRRRTSHIPNHLQEPHHSADFPNEFLRVEGLRCSFDTRLDPLSNSQLHRPFSLSLSTSIVAIVAV